MVEPPEVDKYRPIGETEEAYGLPAKIKSFPKFNIGA
jgi:hypothetical protein